MLTYQDLLLVPETEKDRMDFIKKAIGQHKTTGLYKIAQDAELYDRHRNKTIADYQKLLYTVSGKAVPDIWSANFKMACRHFHRFVVQENQFLLGNGISWNQDTTDERISTKKHAFDNEIQDAGHKALVHGVSFIFFNVDHVEVFDIFEFVPIYDEEDGAMKAGIRYWQVASDKPMRATLYEMDGYTEYIWRKGRGEILQDKRAYKIKTFTSEADGTEIYDRENYPAFPIVPLWGNKQKQSELVGLREQIDCYDLIKSGFANTVDEASLIYWTIQNAGGMDDVGLSQFVERIKTVHAASLEEDGAKAESHTLEAPYQSREALLNRLDKDLYKDAMAVDYERIASGSVVTAQIRAAYNDLNAKCDDYEYCVNQAIMSILELAGIDDEPTFTRSMIVNQSEEIQTILQAAQYLDSEYVTEKILTILGDKDRYEDMIKKMDADEIEQIAPVEEPAEEPAEEELNGSGTSGNR